MSFIDVTGKTEDEAISNALRQLGLERDDVSVQILERAKSGFLGLGSQPAKIRVTYGGPEAQADEVEEIKETKTEPVKAPAQEETETVKEVKAPRKQKSAKTQLTVEKKQEHKAVSAEKSVEEKQEAVVYEEEVNDEKAQAIKTFLSGLLEQMNCPADIHVYLPEKGRYKVVLEGKNLGTLIGRRGETLDAIQQLTSYSVNRTGGRVRVFLPIGRPVAVLRLPALNMLYRLLRNMGR